MDADTLSEVRSALDSGREKDAIALVEAARKAALKRKDAAALEAILPIARQGEAQSGPRREKDWAQLAYAIEQNVAFVSRTNSAGSTPSRMPSLDRGAAPALSASLAPAATDLRSLVDLLDGALDAYRKQLDAAVARVKAAEQVRERRIGAARKAREQAAKSKKLGGGFLLGAGSDLAKVTLYDDTIKTPDGTHDLTPDVQATVDTAGNLMVTRRHTLTRFALMGPFSLFAPKKVKHGSNELYLLIESTTWASVVKCDPKQGVQARKLAQSITLAAREADGVRARRKSAVAEAGSMLALAESDRSEIEEEQRFLANARADRRAVGNLLDRTQAAAAETPPTGRMSRRTAKAIARARTVLEDDGAAEPTVAETLAEVFRPALVPADQSEVLTEEQPDPVEPAPELEPLAAPDEPRDPEPRPPADGVDLVGLIRQLGELRDAGLLTEEEFAAKKADILGRI